MFAHNKCLQYTVRVSETHPGLANLMLGEAELYRSIGSSGNDSHLTQGLYGGGPPLTTSAGVPWTAAYIDTISHPASDLRSNIAPAAA